jgi:hypothetical protein
VKRDNKHSVLSVFAVGAGWIAVQVIIYEDRGPQPVCAARHDQKGVQEDSGGGEYAGQRQTILDFMR